MSSYLTKKYHPRTGKEEQCWALDDYYGPHEYGYKFPDGKVFSQKEVDDTERIAQKVHQFNIIQNQYKHIVMKAKTKTNLPSYVMSAGKIVPLKKKKTVKKKVVRTPKIPLDVVHVKIRIDKDEDTHTYLSVFVNKKLSGHLTLGREEFQAFINQLQPDEVII